MDVLAPVRSNVQRDSRPSGPSRDQDRPQDQHLSRGSPGAGRVPGRARCVAGTSNVNEHADSQRSQDIDLPDVIGHSAGRLFAADERHDRDH